MSTSSLETSDSLVLNVFDGDYGLPSLQIDCLKVLVYKNIAKIPAEVRVLNSFVTCASQWARAPLLQYQDGDDHSAVYSCKNLDLMLLELESRRNLNRKLTNVELMDSFAMECYVKSYLQPVLDFVYWLDTKNREDFTVKWHMKAIPLPFNYYFCKTFREKAESNLEVLFPRETNPETIKDLIVLRATQCLSDLSCRLGGQEYFFGDHPSRLDVIVYSYLAPFVKLKLPSREIGNLIEMWPNLNDFVRRIDDRYLKGHVTKGPKYLKNQGKLLEEHSDNHSYFAGFLFFLSATTMIATFAVHKGILVIK